MGACAQEDPSGNQLEDQGVASTDPNATHHWHENPGDLRTGVQDANIATVPKGSAKMSDEYRIHLDGPVSLELIAKHLSPFRLRVVKSSNELLWMSYEQADAEQPKQWGSSSNVRIEREGENLFVTFTATASRKQLIDALQHAVASQGVGATVEEI
jgi:hypothetical protein